MPIAQLVTQLNDVLNTLTREYRRVISLAQRYPGTAAGYHHPSGCSRNWIRLRQLQNNLRQTYYNPGMTE
jgi:hypothetical protein